ncbi:hypothetical protein D3C80_1078630 [compost metagenome]
MHGNRITVAKPHQYHTPSLHQGGDHRIELAGVNMVHPLSKVGHFLLVVPRQQGVALHRVTIIGQRHAALAQGAQFITHCTVAWVAQAFEQAADGSFGYAAQARQLGAVVADQVVKVIENKIGYPLFLRRKLRIFPAQAFIDLLHCCSCL